MGEFLDWLREQRIHLMVWEPDKTLVEKGFWRDDGRHPERLIADFFGLDIWKLEAERRQMLEHVRAERARRQREEERDRQP